MGKIYLIRHGQSVGNLNRQMLGHTDLPLTEFGQIQAELTAKALASVEIAAVYSSDLIRAKSTAEPHARMRGFEVVSDVRLREIYLGQWECASLDDLLRDNSDLFLDGWRKNFGTFTPPDGESVVDAGKRLYAAILSIARMHKDENLIIASHAAAIRSFWGVITDTPPCDLADTYPYPTNASYSVISFEDDKLVPVEYSVDGHLGEYRTALPA